MRSMSFWKTSRAMLAREKSPSTIIGPRISSIRELPAPSDSARSASAGSSPARPASRRASAAAVWCTATRWLATSFMRIPLPNAPTSCCTREKAARTSWLRLIAAGSPLAYTAMSAARIWLAVPLSGQSSTTAPARPSTRAASALAAIGRVLVSIRIRPSWVALASPCSPPTTCRSAATEGSEVITVGAPAAASAGLAAGTPPASASAAAASGRTS